jgi:hypothetical protein
MFSFGFVSPATAIGQKVNNHTQHTHKAEAFEEYLDGLAHNCHKNLRVRYLMIWIFFEALLPLLTFLFEILSWVITPQLHAFYLLIA